METQSYNIVLMSDLYVIVSQMNVAVKKSEAVLTREPFGKGFVFAADQVVRLGRICGIEDGHLKVEQLRIAGYRNTVYAYGLDDRKLASELPLRNELKRLMSSGLSILEYSAHDKFISVLEQVIVEVAQSSLGSAVKSLTSLDGTEFDADTGMRLKAIWDITVNRSEYLSAHIFNFWLIKTSTNVL